MLIERIVGELELEERDALLHPVASWGRRVWVEVGPAGGVRLRFACHLPFLFIPLQGGSRQSVELLHRKLIHRCNFGPTSHHGLSDGWANTTHRDRGVAASPQQEIEKQEAIAAFDVQCQEKGGGR